MCWGRAAHEAHCAREHLRAERQLSQAYPQKYQAAHLFSLYDPPPPPFKHCPPPPPTYLTPRAEAALVSIGTTVPLSPSPNNFPRLLGVAEQTAHLLQFFEPALFTPNPNGGQPTHLSTSGGFPPQKANTYTHLEVPSGILTQPLWHSPHILEDTSMAGCVLTGSAPIPPGGERQEHFTCSHKQTSWEILAMRQATETTKRVVSKGRK